MFEEKMKKFKEIFKEKLQDLGLIIVALPEIITNFFKNLLQIDLKKKMFIVGMVALLLLAGSNDFSVITGEIFANPVYKINVNGAEYGKVLIDEQELNVDIIKKAVEEKISKVEGVDVKVTDFIQLTESTAPSREIVELSSVEEEIAKNADYHVSAYELIVDSEFIAYLDNDQDINQFFEEVKKPYEFENMDRIFILEEIELNETFVDKSEVVTLEDIKSILSGNKIEEVSHVIVEGDTLWDLAIANEVTLEDIYYSNPGLSENSVLKLDSEIIIVTPVPFISVRTLEEVTYEAVAEREVKYIDNNEEYKTYREVVKEGSDGTKLVTANVVRTNGLESDRLIIKEVVLVEPVEEIIEVGTLNLPPKKAIGTFIMPTTGRISDRFGTRSYGHAGIDIANAAGTRINASDGGKVTFAGWMGNYGKLIIIDHQNGYETYYAHNSSHTVSVGEMVAQGQQIARMGTTGRSTGNHCHFEIRVNGVPQNPFNYVSY